MITLQECPSLSSIQELRADYLTRLTAPMDGMWDTGFTAPAPHWEIRLKGELIGYYAANAEGCLLQFHVVADFETHARACFEHVVSQDALTKIVVSTIDPALLSLCLDLQRTLTVHTYMYECERHAAPDHPEAGGVALRPAEESELDRTVDFQKGCLVGMMEESALGAWLRGYSSNLISRGEIFVLSRGDEWIGLGERRKSDTQGGVSDLGMMVSQDHRRSGWATHILQLLTAETLASGNRAICSTTVENTGAQKAITRAGYVSRHRIMDIVL